MVKENNDIFILTGKELSPSPRSVLSECPGSFNEDKLGGD